MPFYWWANFVPKKDKSLRGHVDKGRVQLRTAILTVLGPHHPEGGAPRGLDSWALQGRRAAAFCSHGHPMQHSLKTQRAVVATP